jgi:FKBP-type peptidyl-prolyl cis-trans isomerase (trigger factor)
MNLPTIKIENKDSGVVSMSGELAWAEFSKFKAEALKKLQETINVDGFRPGKIPEDVLLKKIGDVVMLEEMAQQALATMYPQFLIENKIDAIGRPTINITKLAMDNELGFSIETTVMPKFELPDYKAVAVEANKTKKVEDVTDEEVDKAIDQVLKMQAEQEATKLNDGKEKKDHVEPKVPELTPELAAKFGEFKTVEEFKAHVKETLVKEKEFKAEEKVRIETVEGILGKTEIAVPELLVESELDKILTRMKGDIQNMGLEYDQYLEQSKKTEEGLREEWKKDAEKRAKIQLIVAKISEVEKLTPDQKIVEAEVKKITENYKDANPDQARIYVENILVNEEVFKLLREQK